MKVTSVLITGANRGIGLEFVSQILKLSYAPKWVFAACRNPDQATELQKLAASSPAVRILKLEVTRPEDIQAAVKSVEAVVGSIGLNLLINNAGFSNKCGLDEVTEEILMEHFRVNSVSPLMIFKAFRPLLKMAAARSSSEGMSADKAAVVSISTILSSIEKSNGGNYAYRSSKTALNQINKCLSEDLKSEGILAVVLHPGWVQTKMGGPHATISAADSVSSMLRLIGRLNEKNTGSLLNHDGTPIPW